MTLLTIAQDAAGRLALPIPTTLVGSTDKQAVRLLRLAKEVGKSLNRAAPWKKLQREHVFTTVEGEEQPDGLPTDFDWIMPDTIFDRALRRPVEGPISPEEWQTFKSRWVARVWPAYRIRGETMLLTPSQPAGKTFAFEYISRMWCKAADGTEQDNWLADTDVPILDEELHILGLVTRFKWRSGLDYADDLANFNGELAQAIMREGVRPRINADGKSSTRMSADVLAAARPNVILNSDDSAILWD